MNGALYGTTTDGGVANGTLNGAIADGANCKNKGCGTVYTISTTGEESVLYSFSGGVNGQKPFEGLVNVNGTLYGTTSFGGTYDRGTVFSVSTAGTETVLYSFTFSDGSFPYGPLINVNGTLYGITLFGGTRGPECKSGCGTVYSISETGKETVLHRFEGEPDGSSPTASLVNVNGTLYGTTLSGGGGSHCSGGCGTVYSISAAGVEKVIHKFGYGSDGVFPEAGLIDVSGTLYGTTLVGGGENDDGTVYSVSTAGVEKVLHRFAGIPDGSSPQAPLTNVDGTLYSTTLRGGLSVLGCYFSGCGTIYSINTAGVEKVLYSFVGGSDANDPAAGLTSVNGMLYGATSYGGVDGKGTVYRFNLAGE